MINNGLEKIISPFGQTILNDENERLILEQEKIEDNKHVKKVVNITKPCNPKSENSSIGALCFDIEGIQSIVKPKRELNFITNAEQSKKCVELKSQIDSNIQNEEIINEEQPTDKRSELINAVITHKKISCQNKK